MPVVVVFVAVGDWDTTNRIYRQSISFTLRGIPFASERMSKHEKRNRNRNIVPISHCFASHRFLHIAQWLHKHMRSTDVVLHTHNNLNISTVQLLRLLRFSFVVRAFDRSIYINVDLKWSLTGSGEMYGHTHTHTGSVSNRADSAIEFAGPRCQRQAIDKRYVTDDLMRITVYSMIYT